MKGISLAVERLVPIDFEYHSSEEPNLKLVCCSLMYKGKIYEYWLNDGTDKDRLIRHLNRIKDEQKPLVCFNGEAEGRSLLSLGLDVREFFWIDLQCEWKMLTNRFDKFSYGKQYIKGEYKTTTPPTNKYNQTEEEKRKTDGSKRQTNLLACTYRMLRLAVDKDHKDKMRDLILTKDFNLIQRKKKEILEYCSSDISELLDIWEAFIKAYEEYFLFVGKRTEGMPTPSEVLWRGETSARAALMVQTGYPVDFEKMRTLALNIPKITKDLIEDINSQFDWELFSPNKSAKGYKRNEAKWREYIEKSDKFEKWLKTDTGAAALSEKAFKNVPSNIEGDFFSQAKRYLKITQSLKGFEEGEGNIFSFVGSDKRVRSYLNSYGSQTSRYQPPSKSYLLLKSSWMRSLLHPKKGYSICSIDYKSEEALIGALVAKDSAMIEAYKSNDVYMDFAIRAGAAPKGATKKTHGDIRTLFKSTYLGLSYQMGAKALGEKLTDDTGKLVTQEDAQELIEKFYLAYPDYKKFLDKTWLLYKDLGYIKLFDGWLMFKDNDNYRSASNFPIQGMGGCILRKAIQLAQDAGIKVICPLHDALYVEFKDGDTGAIDTLADCMKEAFMYCFNHHPDSSLIGLDIEVWGDNYKENSYITTPQGAKVSASNVHIEEKAVKDYKQFSKYMYKA